MAKRYFQGTRRRGHQRMRWLESTTNAMDVNLGELQEKIKTTNAMNENLGELQEKIKDREA